MGTVYSIEGLTKGFVATRGVATRNRMLEAGAAAPRDRDALADRLRDGTF